MKASIEKIANLIMSNLHNTLALGLFNGKMGLAIFLYQYANYSGRESYEEVADELIDEIYEKINKNMLPDLFNGLSGVGMGLKFLLQKQYLNGNLDEVLSEVDELLLKDPITSLRKEGNLPNPIYSAGIYLLSRILFSHSEHNNKWIDNIIQAGFSFVEENEKNDQFHFQLSFLNSLLFVYSSLYDKQAKQNTKIKNFINKLFDISQQTIVDERFEILDLLLFKQLSLKFPKTMSNQYRDLCLQVDSLIKNVQIDIELWHSLLWWQFIYGLKSECQFSDKEIEEYVDKLLSDYSFELTSINGQMASLGFYLIDRR